MDVLDDFISRVRKIVGENAEIMCVIREQETVSRHRFGGSNHYVSKRPSKLVRRDIAIQAIKDGKKVHEVAKLADVGRDEVYKLKRFLKLQSKQ